MADLVITFDRIHADIVKDYIGRFLSGEPAQLAGLPVRFTGLARLLIKLNLYLPRIRIRVEAGFYVTWPEAGIRK